MRPLTHAPSAPFIVGVARSGTTLLRFMLDSHPQLAIPAETHFIPAVVQEVPPGTPPDREEFLRRITASFTWADFGLDDATFRAAVAPLEPFTVADGFRIFFRLCAAAQGKPRWGDKTPTYTEHIAAIAQLLPEAHIIHVIRDGRAVAASRRHLAFGPGPDLADQARDWCRRIRTARTQAASCPRYSAIRYEDLVARAETVLRAVCADLELEYDPIMLDYRRVADRRLEEFQDWRKPSGDMFLPGDYRRGIHQRTRQPLDLGRVDHWRTVLWAEEVAAFEAEAGDLLTELGYAAAAGGQLDFLVRQGLQRDTVFLDIGCGCLRGGIHFISCLDPGRYLGMDISAEVVRRGIVAELGMSRFLDKRPEFVISDRYEIGLFSRQPSIALANSVFTHVGPDDIRTCLSQLRGPVTLFATFNESDEAVAVADRARYLGGREVIAYTRDEMHAFGGEQGFETEYVGGWGHPKNVWTGGFRNQMMFRFTRAS
jgi:hypothetical protein